MGHPLFMKPAQTAISQWAFEPFMRDGRPVVVQSLVTVNFSLAPYAKLRDDYLLKEVECTRQIYSKSSQAEAPCQQALNVAIKLPMNFASEKMHAYRNAGAAEKLAQKNNEAVEDFKQQLIIASQALPPGSIRMVQVHNDLAIAYEAATNLPQADAEYTETEKAQEAAITELEARKGKLTAAGLDETQVSYNHNMQIILREHAQLLRRMEKGLEAEALEQKARSVEQSK
jgi:hypothetical protein